MTWHSTYSRSNEALADHLRTILTSLSYTLYDPFAGLTTTAYTDSVKVFVSPPQNGWTRIIGDLPSDVLDSLPGLALHIVLDSGTATIITNVDGAYANPVEALAGNLREGRTLDHLHRALTDPIKAGAKSTQDDVPMHVLPDDLRQMAGQLNPKQINKMFGKLMNKVNRHIGDEDAQSAQSLLGNRTDWDSTGGVRIRRVMSCLDVPEGWDTPDFVTLRDAYQLQSRLQRNPNATRYPGDDEALAAVSDALAYTPVYGGKR